MIDRFIDPENLVTGTKMFGLAPLEAEIWLFSSNFLAILTAFLVNDWLVITFYFKFEDTVYMWLYST